ncbi:DUF6318 family protein [Cellulomonas sp. HD19AZ1]|uniref:DUF6318 family protein n=1 Tax=Cellulomonas sp. HD19AZ1 TaxID=2559593 RepID=UPI001071105C|nr:DUF6318 family protein [Cellulomonas sp. HD19AZ1]TFH72166.1 hypothetical protein E4A51_08685 [Cellulomonas sp. HD19AZ1]
MRMQGRTTRAAVVTGMVVLVAGGCTGSPEPGPATSATTDTTFSPTATPSSSPTLDAMMPPERPAEMSDRSATGASAAASYFFALYPYVFASGDLTEWSALSSETCEYCQNVRRSVEDQTARGVVGEGAEITIESAEGIEVAPGETYAADLVVVQAPSFEVTKDGERVPDGDGGRFQIHVALGWESGWVVRAIDAARA